MIQRSPTRVEPPGNGFAFSGVRTLNIGSNAFNKTGVGQLIEASHEIGHAQVFDKMVKKMGFDAAYEEAFFNAERQKTGTPTIAWYGGIVDSALTNAR